jgi:hypothetical protein
MVKWIDIVGEIYKNRNLKGGEKKNERGEQICYCSSVDVGEAIEKTNGGDERRPLHAILLIGGVRGGNWPVLYINCGWGP